MNGKPRRKHHLRAAAPKACTITPQRVTCPVGEVAARKPTGVTIEVEGLRPGSHRFFLGSPPLAKFDVTVTTGLPSDWLARTGNERGYVMDLPTLWRLAAHWYEGRLDTPYRRREPAEAKEYFASVGLTGPFWGN